MTAKKKTTPKTKAVVKKTKKPLAPKPSEQGGRPIDDILLTGDISSLTVPQRSEFLSKLALSCGLNPMTQPFELIVLDNKLTIYARKGAADQLRKQHKIASKITEKGVLHLGDVARPDVYIVWVRLSLPDEDGCYFTEKARQEDAIGAVGIDGASHEALGNALMKCHTKALRRGTLAFWGISFLDELEVESAKNVMQIDVGVGQPRRVMPTMSIPPTTQQAPSSAPPVVIEPPKAAAKPPTEQPPAASHGDIVILPPGKAPVSTEEK